MMLLNIGWPLLHSIWLQCSSTEYLLMKIINENVSFLCGSAKPIYYSVLGLCIGGDSNCDHIESDGGSSWTVKYGCF